MAAGVTRSGVTVLDYFLNFGKFDYVRRKKRSGCILCSMAKEQDAKKSLIFLRSGSFVACVNLYPFNPGHLMLFPEKHMTDIRAYTREDVETMHDMQCYLLDILSRLYTPSAFNIGYNMGRDSGASIEHIHLHIIPRYPREIGLADLIAGKRVMVESPFETREKIHAEINRNPFQT